MSIIHVSLTCVRFYSVNFRNSCALLCMHWTIECVAHSGFLYCEEISENHITNFKNIHFLSMFFVYSYFITNLPLHAAHVRKVSNCKEHIFLSMLTAMRQIVIEMHTLWMGKNISIEWLLLTDKEIEENCECAYACVFEQYLFCSVNCFQ